MQRKIAGKFEVAKYDVEVIATDDLWAKYGRKLPERVIATQNQAAFRWHYWGARLAGALISIGLHALIVGGAILGTSGRPPSKPLVDGAAAASQSENATEFVSILLLVNDNSVRPSDQPPIDSAYATPEHAAKPAKHAELVSTIGTLTTPVVSGSDEAGDKDSPTAEAFGDEAGRAMLFGRYMGQVKARIERAWEHPVEAATEQFDCSVQIKQDSRGEVQEVTLQRCNDDPTWQVSLVQAIQRASPLSAPPNQEVFSDVITLNFAARSTAQ